MRAGGDGHVIAGYRGGEVLDSFVAGHDHEADPALGTGPAP